jgi:HK97 family phage portal protein
MGFLSGIRPRALGEYTLRQMGGFLGGGTATGIGVNDDSAMRALSVHTCVKAKSNGIKMMPCHLMRRDGKKVEQATDHNVYRLLHDAPNSWMTPSEFWGMASACLDLRGNFYALKSGLPGRPIMELIPLAAGAVQEVVQTPDYGLFYKVLKPSSDTARSAASGGSMGQTGGASTDTIPGDRIMHLRGLSLDGFMGLNTIAYARECIGLELATERHGANLFSHGTNIGGVLSMPAGQFFKDRTQAAKFLADFNENYSSVANSHKAALLENGVTWTKMGMTSVDSQFLEARRFQHRQIVDLFFSIPLSIMTSEDKTATFASSEQFSIAYVIYALMPYIINIEQAIYRDLLTPKEKKTYYAKFEARALLRGSFTEQMTGFATAIDKEIFNPNEVREMLEYNPYPGGEVYRTRTSTTKDPGKDKTPPDDEEVTK